MKNVKAIGPIGFVRRGNKAFYYFKHENEPILVEEKIEKKLRVFVYPEKKEEVLERIKELGDFEVKIFDDVIYDSLNPKKVTLISLTLNEECEMENLELRLKTFQGVVGIEDKISSFKEQDHFLSKMEDYNFSKKFGYFLKTELNYEERDGVLNLVDLTQEFPKNKEDVKEKVMELRKNLVLFTVDYESYGDKLVLGTARTTDNFSKTFIVNPNKALEKEFERLLKPYGVEIEVVPDQRKFVEKIYEERKKGDLEIIHGSSILEKHKDYNIFPSTKKRPVDKFGVKIHYRPVKPLDVITSEGILPSVDSLYACKFSHPEKRSLEENLEFFLGDKETVQKTDYEKFKIYGKISEKTDLERLKKEILETVVHNSQDALAHLKLAEFLLFDCGFIILPMLYCIDLETTFMKVPEEIGEAIFTSELVSNKVFPKITNSYTSLKKKKERIIKSNKKILTERFGERYEGRWIYPFYGFVPEIVLKNEEMFGDYVPLVLKRLIGLKGGLEVYGVDEVSGKNIIFDPFSFIMNCASAYLLFGRKIFTDENISSKILTNLNKLYSGLKEEKFGGCEIIYFSPFESRIFVSGTEQETKEFIEKLDEKYEFLLAAYNKHKDIFIPLNKNQAIATESGRIVKIGFRGTSRTDPMVVREAFKNVLNILVKYGVEEARSEFEREMENIGELRYPLRWYKFSGRLHKKPYEYKKETVKLKIMEKAFQEYRKIHGEYPKGFIDFFITEKGIDFSDIPESRINTDAYKTFFMQRIKPLLPFFKLKVQEKNMRLTSYF
ncbi:MAG: hypothetical protein QXS37_00900 [Candidatus Aenigmatarchaeota archaeon]